MRTSNTFFIKILAALAVLGVLLAVMSGCAQKQEKLTGLYVTTRCYYTDPDSVPEEEKVSIERYHIAFQFYDENYCEIYSGEWIDEKADAEGVYEWERASTGTYLHGENGAVVIGSFRGKLEYKSGGRIFFYVQDDGLVLVLKKSDLTPYDLIKSYEDWQEVYSTEGE